MKSSIHETILTNFIILDQDDDRLVIIENQEIPSWAISRRLSKNNYLKNDLLGHAIKIQESKKIYQFFTLTSSKELENFSFINTYTPYIEHIVPKNSLTGYENIDHDVLEYKTIEEEMIVYLWVLKNEYRTF